MPDTLIATTPLNGASEIVGTLTLAEATPEIVSVATPLGGRDALAKQVKSKLGAALPDSGGSTVSKDEAYRLLWTAPDQMLVLGPNTGADYEAAMNEMLAGKGYVTLQSDNWCAVEVTGADCRAMLNRLSMFDLDPEAFAIGDVKRGLMEHMNAILTRTGEDSYLLLSASSSAQSFWKALSHAAHTVTGLKTLA